MPKINAYRQDEDAQEQDQYWMSQALKLAKQAKKIGEVPVGALIVQRGQVLASATNLRETLNTPLGHAELIAVHRAAKRLGSWRLADCTLYVTLEPCVMCAGALVQARLPRLVFGATDPKGGGTQSLYQIPTDTRLNHRIDVTGGVLDLECSLMLKDFFRQRREQNRQKKSGSKDQQ